jgi:hypothetical protein
MIPAPGFFRQFLIQDGKSKDFYIYGNEIIDSYIAATDMPGVRKHRNYGL